MVRLLILSRYLPSFVKRTRIPATRDTPLLDPESESKQWPVALFSHGLGGTYNAYSYLCGNLASCGMVVFAIEHRDGSAPITVVNCENNTREPIYYNRISHDPRPEILDARNDQLQIRMSELDMLYAIIDQLNQGKQFTNLAPDSCGRKACEIPFFDSKLDMRPSKVVWIGHSFGAATMVQFLKSVYWSHSLPKTKSTSTAPHDGYLPVANGALESQVTSRSPVVLLDLWTMPLKAEKSQWLYEKPLPCFAHDHSPTSTVLSVMSEQFYNWKELRDRTRLVLSGKPESTGVDVEEMDEKRESGPRLFYVKGSAHLSQSEFGVLFPVTTKRFMGAAEPDRTMNLNVRAILQLLRENDIPMKAIKPSPCDEGQYPTTESSTIDDQAILGSNVDIRNWTAIPLYG